MSLVVNTNVGSLNAQRSLASSSNQLATAMERLASGKKINSAADDAAGFAIAERMTAQVRGLNMATKNANDGLSMLAVIENATNDVTDMLQRMRELAVQASNDTNSAADRGYLQKEADALLAEINRVANQTEYNGQTILDGTYQNKAIQVGTDAGQKINLSVASISAENLSLETTQSTGLTVTSEWFDSGRPGEAFIQANDNGFNLQVGENISFSHNANEYYQITSIDIDPSAGTISVGVDVTSSTADELNDWWMTTGTGISVKRSDVDLVNNPSSGLGDISNAIEALSAQRAEYGALQNRLEYTVSNLMNVSEFTTAARSRIEDADFAAESARLAKAQVLQQTGTAMLAQANSTSQLVSSLVR